MAQYIAVPIDTDEEDLIAMAVASLQSRFPAWQPHDGNLDTAVIEAFAVIAAMVRDIASQVPDTIFRYYGSTIQGIQPIDATSSTVSSTWTVTDTLGHLIEDGTQVGIKNATGDLVAFTVDGDVTIPPGASTTPAGAVLLRSVSEGADTAGIGGPGVVAELYDVITWVAVGGVVLTGYTTGGVDAELDEDYLNRLRTRLQLMTPRPIKPREFAVLAQDVAGVYRSTSLDLYNPADGTFNNPRMVTVFSVDENGEAVSAPVKANIDTYLQGLREVNFVVNEADPTYSTVDITYKAQILPGYSASDVETRVEQALNDYLDNATWGQTSNSDPRTWDNKPAVRYLEVAQVINGVTGIDFITTTAGNYDLTMRVAPAAYARSDIVMTGVVPLPRPGVIDGTIIAP